VALDRNARCRAIKNIKVTPAAHNDCSVLFFPSMGLTHIVGISLGSAGV